MAEDFTGKVAIVTGGASGIGAAIARELTAGGASVLVADLNGEAARAMADELGATADAFAVNVADPDQVSAMVDHCVARFGVLHLAANCAGIGSAHTAVADTSIADWERVINVNLNGVFYCMKYEIAAMLQSGGGSIVNMASISGVIGNGGAAAYNASKHGVVGVTKAAALEYARRNVRVNAIGPGVIKTPLISNDLGDNVPEWLVNAHPVGRLGEAEEVAALAGFLLSDRARFITGSHHMIDGGYTAQ